MRFSLFVFYAKGCISSVIRTPWPEVARVQPQNLEVPVAMGAENFVVFVGVAADHVGANNLKGGISGQLFGERQFLSVVF